MLAADSTEVARQRQRDAPRGWEEALEARRVPLQHLFVPLVTQLRLLERAKLAKGLEGVLVRRELPAAEPRHHLLACLGAERVDHEARAW